MLWKQIFIKGLRKAGFTEAEITEGLGNLETDVEDTVANSRLNAIYTADEARGNDAIFKDVKDKTRAEALNPIDTEIKALEEDLTPEQKTAYTALGNNTFEKIKYLTKTTKENLKAAAKTGDVNYDELKASYDKVMGSLETDYVKKGDHETVLNELSDKQKELIYGRALSVARKAIKSDKKDQRHFERNFISDVEDVLTNGIITTTGGKDKVKGLLDYKTGKIMRVDSPDQPLMINGEAATIESIVPFAVDHGEYDKDYVPITPNDSIIIPGSGAGGKAELSEAAKRNMEYANGLK